MTYKKSFRTIAGLNNNRTVSKSEARGHSIYAVDLHLNLAFKFRGDQINQYIPFPLTRTGSNQLWVAAEQHPVSWLLPYPHLRLLEPHKKTWESRQDHPTLALNPILSVFLVLVLLASDLEPLSTNFLQKDAPFGWPIYVLITVFLRPFCPTSVSFWLYTRQPASEPYLQMQEDSALKG